uniref:Uncharacterized protein n=1 Tax=Chenopodium quinoa TaxID=63459 RepID=A0A803LTC1_CHEQI
MLAVRVNVILEMDAYSSELDGKEFAYDGEKTLFTVGSLPTKKLEFTVLLDKVSSERNPNAISDALRGIESEDFLDAVRVLDTTEATCCKSGIPYKFSSHLKWTVFEHGCTNSICPPGSLPSISGTSSGHGGVTSAGNPPVPEIPKLHNRVCRSMFFC